MRQASSWPCTALGGRAAGPAIEAVADRLVAAIAWQGDDPDWYK